MSPPRSKPKVTAIVVAAGRGERFGAADKVLQPLAGRPMLLHVLDAIDGATTIDDIILVVGRHIRAAIEQPLSESQRAKPVRLVAGGVRRQDSVELGLRATSSKVEVVAIHDAARPLATPSLFDQCVIAAISHGAAIAAIPVADTIKRASGGVIEETIPRVNLWAAQTPQAFQRDLLVAAFADPRAQTTIFTDEASLVETIGHSVAIVPGERLNLKITEPDDLAIAQALIETASRPIREQRRSREFR